MSYDAWKLRSPDDDRADEAFGCAACEDAGCQECAEVYPIDLYDLEEIAAEIEHYEGWKMSTCEIKWVCKLGVPTPDEEPAIGRVMSKAHVQQIGGRGIRINATPWFLICEEHAKRLSKPGMENWVFERFACEEVA